MPISRPCSIRKVPLNIWSPKLSPKARASGPIYSKSNVLYYLHMRWKVDRTVCIHMTLSDKSTLPIGFEGTGESPRFLLPITVGDIVNKARLKCSGNGMLISAGSYMGCFIRSPLSCIRTSRHAVNGSPIATASPSLIGTCGPSGGTDTTF